MDGASLKDQFCLKKCHDNDKSARSFKKYVRECGVDAKVTKICIWGYMLLGIFFCPFVLQLNFWCFVSHEALIKFQRAATKTHPRDYL